jgi:DNA-binding NarL/FixJ family response regulator
VSGPVRIVIADDHPMFRFGLRAALDGTPEVEVVGEAGDGAELLDVLAATEADVVLTDLEMPGAGGLSVAARLATTHPQLPVVLLTMHDEPDTIRQAIAAGARGYLLKGAERDEIVSAVLAAASGGAVYGPAAGDVVRSLATAPTGAAAAVAGLTPREAEVLGLVAHGLGNLEIGRRLGLSEKTVRNHVSNLLVKLAVPTRAAAVARARDLGL